MKMFASQLASSVSLALLAASAACGAGGGSKPGDGVGEVGGVGGVELPPQDRDYIFPGVTNTGFDGTHVFKVPLSTSLKNVTWKVDDPTIADIVAAPTPDLYAEWGETWAMVTTKQPGTTKITVTAGGKSLTSMLVVTAYTAANISAGDKRYNNPDNPTAAQRNACASCHKLLNSADHSPVVLEFYKDDEILSAITTGMYPKQADGSPGYVLQGVPHTWNLTDAERQAIVPYLRTLQPRGF